ncbi:hypothetical protein [uncultured Bradyrhizobium sp.]|uniref:hypothetical protein n=1 Tax=uncultured Bradyrhizobium sp. TaxID=199684 RepID=UPI0035CA545A
MATELAPANSADTSAESVQATPSDGLDNSPETWDYADPDEDQDNPETKTSETDSNSETDEAPASQETEEPATETETTEKPAQEPDDSIVIAMPGGEKLELKELKSGYLRDRDYRHKTTDLANKRRELEALSTRVTQSASAISEVLMSQVPPEPDPSLSLTDPLKYLQDKAQHEGALKYVNSILEKANTAKDVGNTLTQEQQTEINRVEIAKLTEAFPVIKTADGQKKFFDAALGGARELGFSDTELQGVNDHRIFKVLHYAKLGLEAEAAKTKAAGKVVNVPPIAPQKRQAGPNAAKARANQDAMRRLAQTGSIQDAMAVDFD